MLISTSIANTNNRNHHHHGLPPRPQDGPPLLRLLRHPRPHYLPYVAGPTPCQFPPTNTRAVVDTVPLLPSVLVTELSHTIRQYYISNYHDKFFQEAAPAWFSVFIAMELLYHTPLSIWAIWALWKGTVHLLDMPGTPPTKLHACRPPSRSGESPRIRRPVLRHLHGVSRGGLELDRPHHQPEANPNLAIRTLCRAR